jgi:hypothetical protein
MLKGDFGRKEQIKWQNRTANVTLADLAEEFRDLVENEEETSPAGFIDSVIEDVKNQAPEESYDFTVKIGELFCQLFGNKLKAIIEKRMLTFPLKMDELKGLLFKIDD